ncbi:MAG: glutathione S-transferase family protein [Alphaproteobacteria bacterium]|jgi:glutathione S-transferase|nr:glutathione S-transferase family protein [Alphaproteobacteria bacterium]
MLKLYDFLESGNGYKCRLLLSQLGRPFELILKDILKGETRTPEFLAINSNGRIPVLELEDGRRISESGAILVYLAEGTPFLSDDDYEQAQALQWLFFEQYSHEPAIAVARFWRHFLLDEVTGDAYMERALAEKMEKGNQALDVMERHLDGRTFFVGERYSIADIALYAYTHVADEGGFDLDAYPNIRAWLDRVAEQPGHVLITQSTFE